MLRAGLLKEHISIYSLHPIKSEYGETTYSYELYYQTSARVQSEKGIRTVENNEIVHSYNLIITVRSYCPIAYTDQIHYLNEIYRVISIERNIDNNSTQIIAERVNQ